VERVTAEVIRTETAQHREVQDSDHRWYALRVLPYRGSDQVVRGAVLELVPASPMRKVGPPGEIHDYAEQVLWALPHPMALVDPGMAVVWTNGAFLRAFGDPRSLSGGLRDLWRGVEPDVWRRIEGALERAEALVGLTTRVTLTSGEERELCVSVHAVPPQARRWALITVESTSPVAAAAEPDL